MRKLMFLLAAPLLYSCCEAQFTLTTNYNQDFNSLLPAGTGNLLPSGWLFSETGTAADDLYTAGTGSGSTGDTYSFGVSAVGERALGTLQSGSLQTVFGFYFTNATGNAITRLTVTYTGEQWRLGAVGRNDRLDFQFSLNANLFTNGDWADFDQLDLISPVSSSPTGALDGNASINKRLMSASITGILIPPGNTCFFRWTDPDASGADDGLAIDDFSIEPGFATASTLFYQSKTSGNWSALSSWEVSSDQQSWTGATEIPGQTSAGIRIRSGHTINHQFFASADQLIIETGAVLQHSGGQFTLNDGAGDDLQIENGGLFHLSAAGNGPLFTGPATVIRVKSGAILRISAGGLSTVAGAGVHAANYVYEDAAVLENAYNGMGANGVTYFPNVSNNTIPVLRIVLPISLPVGAAAFTRVNGVLEVNGNISFTATGQKIFRNGIRGSGTITTTATAGLLVVDGATAILGGSGMLNVSASAGLQIGAGTTVTMISDKTINGTIALSPAASYIDLGDFQLRVSGTVSGGGVTSYIRTGGIGSLFLENIPAAGKLFPVGHTRYNPVLIEKGSGLHWSVRVNDGVVPDFPYTSNGAVLLTWHIQPSVNPPVSGADITFQFDRLNQTGIQFNTPPFDTEPVQAWHRGNGYWLTANVPQPLVNAGGDMRTVKITGLTEFSPYGLSRLGLPLPLKLLFFYAVPLDSDHIRLNWKLAEPVSALFIPEFSLDGIYFYPVDTVSAQWNKTEYMQDISGRITGWTYCRLKIIEPGGNNLYSPVIKLNFRQSEMSRLQLYPNRVIGMAQLRINVENDSREDLLILDNTGKLLGKMTIQLRKGPQSVPVDLSGLPAGMYYLLLKGKHDQPVIPFIKL